jgi:hypothetical protein
MIYTFPGDYADFPETRSKLDQAGVSILSIYTADSVLHVEVEGELPEVLCADGNLTAA